MNNNDIVQKLWNLCDVLRDFNLLNAYKAILLALSTGKRIEIQKSTNAD